MLTISSQRYRGSQPGPTRPPSSDRKSTRLNSSHANISYAVFCLKKKTEGEGGGGKVSLCHREAHFPPFVEEGHELEIDLADNLRPHIHCLSLLLPGLVG